MSHPWYFQGPTGLEATGGPRGPSQPLQSIKIDYKRNLDSKYTQHRPPQRVYDFCSSLKPGHHCQFQVPTGLEATGGPSGPTQPLQSIKIDQKMDFESKYTQHRLPQRVYDFYSSLKMCHPWHFQGPTGLKAIGGPVGPAQPLQSIKIN